MRSHSRPFFIGIDCGGTHTTAALVSSDGRSVSVGKGGPANLKNNTEGQVTSSIEEAVADAHTRGPGLFSPEDCQGLTVGFAGISAGEAIGRRIMTKLNLASPDRSVITHDIRIAWAGAFGVKPGIVVIAGTGSAAFGVGSNGMEARAGGLGTLQDGGSAFRIVCDALAAMFPGDAICGERGTSRFVLSPTPINPPEAVDPCSPTSLLMDGMLHHFGARDLTTLRDKLKAHRQEVRTIAAAAPAVVSAARNGDAVARRIMISAFRDLTRLITNTQSKLASTPGELPVCIVGGVAASIPLFPREFRDQVMTAGVNSVRQPLFAPHFGAALLAARQFVPNLTDHLTGALVSSMRRQSDNGPA